MNVKQKYNLPEDTELINRFYEDGREDTRLTYSKAARVEFLTNTRAIEQMVPKGARILDVGAGTGQYSLYLASREYRVSALELADTNVAIFRKKLQPGMNIDLRQGNALDLSMYEENSFDAVLLMGPLYHLHDEAERQRCIAQARRVCKPGGLIFFAFLGNDMIILTEFSYRPNYFTEDTYACMFGMGIPIGWGDCTDESIKKDVAFAKSRGILAWLFCADTEKDVRRCVAYDCDNITGNDPEVALTVLREMNLHA